MRRSPAQAVGQWCVETAFAQGESRASGYALPGNAIVRRTAGAGFAASPYIAGLGTGGTAKAVAQRVARAVDRLSPEQQSRVIIASYAARAS